MALTIACARIMDRLTTTPAATQISICSRPPGSRTASCRRRAAGQANACVSATAPNEDGKDSYARETPKLRIESPNAEAEVVCEKP